LFRRGAEVFGEAPYCFGVEFCLSGTFVLTQLGGDLLESLLRDSRRLPTDAGDPNTPVLQRNRIRRNNPHPIPNRHPNLTNQPHLPTHHVLGPHLAHRSLLARRLPRLHLVGLSLLGLRLPGPRVLGVRVLGLCLLSRVLALLFGWV
jgi:hypothetical protein